VNPNQCDQFPAQWPAIKAEWLKLLRGEPVLSPLGRPDTLVFLMDATLMQLQLGLQAAPGQPWLRHCRPVTGSVHRHCACGLNPLLKYFTTGEVALRAVAGPALPADIDDVLARFRALARHEVDALCSICQHPGAAGCELRPTPGRA
jgi:hypothetical protein